MTAIRWVQEVQEVQEHPGFYPYRGARANYLTVPAVPAPPAYWSSQAAKPSPRLQVIPDENPTASAALQSRDSDAVSPRVPNSLRERGGSTNLHPRYDALGIPGVLRRIPFDASQPIVPRCPASRCLTPTTFSTPNGGDLV
jgi:hypothetical protein